MLTPLLLSYIAAGQGAPPISPAALISKMLARYASAKSLQGTIRTTQSAQNASVTTLTTVAYERPSKILVSQKQGGSTPKSVLLVSNGTLFAYTTPERLLTQNEYLGEPVQAPNGVKQTVGDLYAIVASRLPDRSPVLDLLVARIDDLKYVAAQFARFSSAGKTRIGEREVNEIRGQWRENGIDTSVTQSAVGEFEIYVTDDGELVRYVLRQNFGVPSPVANGTPAQTIEVTNTWDATVTINAPVAPETFALRASGG